MYVGNMCKHCMQAMCIGIVFKAMCVHSVTCKKVNMVKNKIIQLIQSAINFQKVSLSKFLYDKIPQINTDKIC